MKVAKRLIYTLLFLAAGASAFSQQLPLYSQYLYNKFLINPAHAGSDGFTSFNLTAREQWAGYTGAPRTYSFSWQTRLLKKEYRLKKNILNRTVYIPKTDGKVGFGGYIFSDRNGLIQRTGFQGSYSYHSWISDYTQLSMGLAFTGYHFIIRATGDNFEDPNDPWLNDNLRKGIFIPDADFGIYILNPRFDIGFSALQMFGATARIGKEYKNLYMDRHFYLFGSYSYFFGVKNELETSTLFKVSEQLKPQADIGLTFIHDRSFFAGVTYRTGGALIGNLRVRCYHNELSMTSLFIGYAYDFTLNKIQTVTYGTHELMVALKFGDSDKRFRWLDRY